MGDCVVLMLILLLCLFASKPTLLAGAQQGAAGEHQQGGAEELISSQPKKAEERVIEVKGDPESVIWVVQLSDLHFSVYHPDRAIDFKNIVGPALQMINPSLVLITGDLTDGKSKDLLTMKQNEDEWLEYQSVMEEVVRRSGLDKSNFYDLRGNHDNFGVPVAGGSFDFFSKYSINGQLRRGRNVNSVTVETGKHKHLFVGLDSTMSVGLRGPTNLFGHPTDQLLSQIDSELSHWDSQSGNPVTKVSFGHFPLSFSASSHSGKSLKDIFLKHSLSAYLCGHLHTRFGKNLKRHHQSSQNFPYLEKFFQLNLYYVPSESTKNCSFEAPAKNEFWEWEMGDWKKSRAMRIMAIDRGYVSYVDIDFKLGAKKTIVLPTFPLDSRFMSTSSSHQKYECQHMVPSSFGTVRSLVFSASSIVSVVARVFDAIPGTLEMIMETPMSKVVGNTSRGEFYAASWNYKAFEDPSPDRFWLQIEVIDIMGRSTLSELRPFSINGLSAKVSWTWKEFLVMGCQWAVLYYPILWSGVTAMLATLIIPKVVFVFSKKQYSYKSFIAGKGLVNGIGWIIQDLYRVPIVWLSFLGYLIYLIVCPWFLGQVFTDNGDKGYMTYMGWVVQTFGDRKKHEYIGSPDVMVVVLPHLFFVVFPAIFVAAGLVAERSAYKEHYLSLSGKKEDDHCGQKNKQCLAQGGITSKFGKRKIRKVFMLFVLAICWKHFKNCRALMKAYDMILLLHFPVYSLAIPLLLVYTLYKTRRFQ